MDLSGSPDIILMIWLVIQLIWSLEFLPYRWTAALKELVNGVLIFTIYIGFGEHLKIWNESVAWTNMLNDSINFAGISTRFL